jgi:DNA-binding MarR family transcriptional regulator
VADEWGRDRTVSRRAPGSPEDSPGFLLWRTTLRWQRSVSAVLRPMRLTHVQFVLLASVWWLSRTSGPPSQRQLADHASTDVMMTSQVLRTLEARGLVRRSTDPTDARVRRLTITPAGVRLAERAVAAVEQVDGRFFGPLADRPRLLEALRALADR